MKYFNFFSRQQLLNLTAMRKFETKIGEVVEAPGDEEGFKTLLANENIKYVLFGIPEDIGVKANFGKGGADSAWRPFLTSFLNLQSNDYLEGKEMMLAGYFDFSELKHLIDKNASGFEEKVDAYRHAVHAIDYEVESLSKMIAEAGKIPIAIGGGHNNAYPLIKGSAKGLHKQGKSPIAQINCINLDAHSDFRPAEGRHSGNGFRYAEEDGYLKNYFIIGLQENYIQQNVLLDILNSPFIDCISYEDIFLRKNYSFHNSMVRAYEFTSEGFTGIELDLDVIENTVSSAVSPSGINAAYARQYMHFFGAHPRLAYLHIAEGAAFLEDGQEQPTIGKLIALLVSDFVKAGKPRE